ncbi:hypothetical protein [Actinomycetospora straminea]|uniref:hypothetical protein n=1 Tax=Actinomycetospora straminea TaxID=663607 RepID=UPI002365920C|nr:hypothetical protein [Actinomycetospora straminea]MDD7933719.1 hypothetical protein [Actinomycetospora straminea]
MLLIASGWLYEDSSYLSNLLLQVGSAFLLVVPLAALGRLFEKRLQKTEERSISNSQDLRELDSTVGRNLVYREGVHVDHGDGGFEAPTAVLRDQVLDAMKSGILASDGVLVERRSSGEEVWLSGGDDNLVLRRLAPSGQEVGRATWSDDDPLPPWTMLDPQLADDHAISYGYDQDLNSRLQKLVKVVRHGLSGAEYGYLENLVEVVNEQWALTKDGLRSLDRYYFIPLSRLLDTHEDWRAYMGTRGWVNWKKFDEAFSAAERYYDR